MYFGDYKISRTKVYMTIAERPGREKWKYCVVRFLYYR